MIYGFTFTILYIVGKMSFEMLKLGEIDVEVRYVHF